MKEQSRGWMIKVWNCRAVWACAGLVLAAIILFGPAIDDRTGPALINPPLVASNSPAPSTHTGVPWYIRSGQWQADMRSLSAVLKFLTDPEKIVQTNPIPARADNA